MGTFALELLKTVSATKRVNHPLLNRAGAQVARVVAARALKALHPSRGSADTRQWSAKLRDRGIVVIDDFLAPEVFEKVREAALDALRSSPERSRHDHGACIVEHVPLAAQPEPTRAGLAPFFADPRLRALFEKAERRRLRDIDGHRAVERATIVNRGVADRESHLHVDTFFSTHKGWLFLRDVEESDSAFVYVPGSQKLSAQRLGRIYRESISKNEGSRRISPDELEEAGLREVVYRCRANTLVVANTFGFHRREPGREGSERLALHQSYRFNPFFPAVLRADKLLSNHNPLVRRLRRTNIPS